MITRVVTVAMVMMAGVAMSGCAGMSAAAAPGGGAAPGKVTFTDGTATAPDGVAIAYSVGGPAERARRADDEVPDKNDSRGENAPHAPVGPPALVFVHGWSCDRTYWRHQLAPFAAAHTVVAIDLGGHGESGTNRTDWTIEAFADDVRAVVEALDLRRVVLIGHSLSCNVVVEAAARMPERVAAIVAVDGFTNVLTAEQRAYFRDVVLANMRADFVATTEQMIRQFTFRKDADPALVARLAADMAAAPPAVGISAMGHLIEHDTRLNLAATSAPIRLLNADLTPTDLPFWRAQRPDLTLAVMPGTGHYLMLEQPVEFNRLLARAVRELTSAPPPSSSAPPDSPAR